MDWISRSDIGGYVTYTLIFQISSYRLFQIKPHCLPAYVGVFDRVLLKLLYIYIVTFPFSRIQICQIRFRKPHNVYSFISLIFSTSLFSPIYSNLESSTQEKIIRMFLYLQWTCYPNRVLLAKNDIFQRWGIDESFVFLSLFWFQSCYSPADLPQSIQQRWLVLCLSKEYKRLKWSFDAAAIVLPADLTASNCSLLNPIFFHLHKNINSSISCFASPERLTLPPFLGRILRAKKKSYLLQLLRTGFL